MKLIMLFLMMLAAGAYALTNISSCGNLAVSNETYVLSQDIAVNGSCFAFVWGNITLDCAGHSITGNGTGVGVSGFQRDNLNVRNCTFVNFSIPVSITLANNVSVKDIAVRDSNYGLWLWYINRATVSNITVSNITYQYGYGMWLQGVNNTAFSDMDLSYNSSIQMYSSNNVTFTNVTGYNESTISISGGNSITLDNVSISACSGQYMIAVSGASNLGIFRSSVSDGGMTPHVNMGGFVIYNTNDTVISDSTARNIANSTGLWISNSERVNLENLAFYDTFVGMELEAESGVSATNISAYGGSYGMFLVYVFNSTFSGVSVVNSTYYGIGMDVAENNTLSGLSINSSGAGLWLDSVNSSEIRDFDFHGNGAGIYVSWGSHYNSIHTGTMGNSSSYGVQLNENDNSVSGVSFSGNLASLQMNNGNNDSVSNSSFENDTNSIFTVNAINYVISDSTFRNIRYNAVFQWGANGTLLENLKMSNVSTGVSVYGSSNGTLANIEMADAGTGLSISGSSDEAINNVSTYSGSVCGENGFVFDNSYNISGSGNRGKVSDNRNNTGFLSNVGCNPDIEPLSLSAGPDPGTLRSEIHSVAATDSFDATFYYRMLENATFQNISGVESAPFAWYPCNLTDAVASVRADDDNVIYSLPWAFGYLGSRITSISAGTNGFVELLEDGEAPHGSWVMHQEGDHLGMNDFIFIDNDDLETDDSADTYLAVCDMGDKVVVEWFGSTYENYDSADHPVHSQLVLFQNGSVMWNFMNMSADTWDYGMYSGYYSDRTGDDGEVGAGLGNGVSNATTGPTYVSQSLSAPIGISTVSLPPFSDNETRGVTVYWNTTSLGPGNYTIGVFADSSHAIHEIDEANNVLESAYMISGGNQSGGNESNQSVPGGNSTDSIPPSLSIISPGNTSYNSSALALDYTASDDVALDSCWYSVDSGAAAQLPACANSSMAGLADGPHTVQVFANDSSGNNASVSASFSVNTSAGGGANLSNVSGNSSGNASGWKTVIVLKLKNNLLRTVRLIGISVDGTRIDLASPLNFAPTQSRLVSFGTNETLCAKPGDYVSIRELSIYYSQDLLGDLTQTGNAPLNIRCS